MAFLRLVCLLTAVVTVTAFREGCAAAAGGGGEDDVPLPPEVKIGGGKEVDIKNFPFQVYINRTITFCGGVIISERWVLTAAHCMVGFEPAAMTIRVGSNDKFSGGDVYDVEKVITHPQYMKSMNYDISAVKISKNIKFNLTLGVDKVQLPELTPPANTKVNVTGWGRVGPNDTDVYPIKLKGAESSVVNFSDCLNGCDPKDEKFMLCLKPEDGGVCPGDSGGPVTKDNVLYGINSSAWPPCGFGYAFVTNVAAFRQWIKETTQV